MTAIKPIELPALSVLDIKTIQAKKSPTID